METGIARVAAASPEECRTDPAEEPSILSRGERIAVYLVEECGPYVELIEPDVIEMRRIMARIDRRRADNAAEREVHAIGLCSPSAAGSPKVEAIRSGSDPGPRPRTERIRVLGYDDSAGDQEAVLRRRAA